MNEQPNEVSLCETRKYLVILPYARETLYFAITSHEATSPEEAIQVAAIRVEGDTGYAYLDDLFLGQLVRPATAVADTDENRTRAGISDEGYPSTFTEFSWDWYDGAAFGAPPAPRPKPKGRMHRTGKRKIGDYPIAA